MATVVVVRTVVAEVVMAPVVVVVVVMVVVMVVMVVVMVATTPVMRGVETMAAVQAVVVEERERPGPPRHRLPLLFYLNAGTGQCQCVLEGTKGSTLHIGRPVAFTATQDGCNTGWRYHRASLVN